MYNIALHIRDTGFFTSSSFYDYRTDIPRLMAGNLEKNLELVDALIQIANDKGCSLAQLSLAWLLAQGSDDIIPIPGSSNQKHLIDNCAAVNIKLTTEDLSTLETAYRHHPPVGLRISAGALELFNLNS